MSNNNKKENERKERKRNRFVSEVRTETHSKPQQQQKREARQFKLKQGTLALRKDNKKGCNRGKGRTQMLM